MKKSVKKGVCLLLCTMMVGSFLTGCSVDSVETDMNNFVSGKMDVNATITKDSKWVNSDVIGSVSKNKKISKKDDFAAAINKNWLLASVDKAQKYNQTSTFDENDDTILEQKNNMANTAINGGEFKETETDVDQKTNDHVTELYSQFVRLASDWDQRNEEGTKPLEKYIQAIQKIDSMEDMDNYLINEDGLCFSKDYLLPFSVEGAYDGSNKNAVMIRSDLAEVSTSNTEKLSDELVQTYEMAIVTDVLKEYGYSAKEAKKMVKECWALENILLAKSNYAMNIKNGVSEKKAYNHQKSKEELANMTGSYPLFKILEHYGYGDSKNYTVWEPKYVQAVGDYYKESNLERIKSYYMVHTIMNALPLMSRDYYDEYVTYFEKKEDTTEEDSDDGIEKRMEDQLTDEEKITQDLLNKYMKVLSEEMYILQYSSVEKKEYLTNMVNQMLESYEEIIQDEDWMSDATKAKAIEKLKCITVRVVYPDQMDDYAGLDFEGDTLLDAVSAMQEYQLKKGADKINQTVNKMDWDLKQVPTTDVNSCYDPTSNSVYIYEGITAADSLFSLDASYEENLGRLGLVIGHEISHAFDTSGYLYDKDGNQKKWWTQKDEENFQKRVGKLTKYYSSLAVFRDYESISGDQIKGEAIADMGGMKCGLAIAKKREGFDYKKYFQAYGTTFTVCRTLSTELKALSEDEHPLGFLRTNVTVQQFEEFYETFGVKKGDGMYLAPKARIAVW